MRFTTTVKLVLKEEPNTVLPNVKVALFDKDTFTKDDPLGTAVTDQNGEALFEYTTEQFLDIDDRMGTEFPDLYTIVYDSEDRIIVNTRTEVIHNTPRKRITVPIERGVAQEHHLVRS
jgi:hypothetical protein